MKKLVRNQLIGLLRSVDDGARYAARTVAVQAAPVLDDCKAALTNIGEVITEQLSEIRAKAYSMRINEILAAMNAAPDTYKKKAGSVRRELSLIISGLLHEPEVLREILFLPYNINMWDSLESVWRAAKADPRNSCSVVPLPFYDKEADGSFKLECHASLYPEEVGVIDYSQYDIALNQPDVIFIHNAYNGVNKVTQVASEFFNENLKRHTGMLVYIPYYTSAGPEHNSFVALETYKSVDKIIVQNEYHRKQYLRHWPPEKIVALGSPKFDKILNCREAGDIPEQWKDIARGRSIVLYNTSLSAFLCDSDVYLKKLRYVFTEFSKSEKLVLLWRPHPLLKKTLIAICPELYGTYTALERSYIINRVGIYDDSPDMYTALAAADAYFGDGSSLVPLFGVKGKPIVIQLPQILEKPDCGILSAWDMAFDEDDSLCFTPANFNGLFRARIGGGEAEFLGLLPGSLKVMDSASISMAAVGGAIIFAPFSHHSVVEFRDGEFSCRELDESYVYTPRMRDYFSHNISLNGSTWFIPRNFKAVLQYKHDTGECLYHDGWWHKAEPYADYGIRGLFGLQSCARGNSLLMPFSGHNLVMEYDTVTRESTLHILGGEDRGFRGIEFDGEAYWLIPYTQGPLLRWDYNTGSCAEFGEYPQGFSYAEADIVYMAFESMVYLGEGRMLILPRQANMALLVDTRTGAMREFPGMSSSILGYTKPIEREGYLYTQNRETGMLLRISMKSESIEELGVIRLPSEHADALIDPDITTTLMDGGPFFIFKNYINEKSCRRGVVDFLEKLLQSKNIPDERYAAAYRSQAVNCDGTCGEKIYQYISSCIDDRR